MQEQRMREMREMRDQQRRSSSDGEGSDTVRSERGRGRN